jgi:hypothetical protein
MSKAVLVLCAAAALSAQTLVHPTQIRNWYQTQPIVGRGAVRGTRLSLHQIRYVPEFAAAWRAGDVAPVRAPGPWCMAAEYGERFRARPITAQRRCGVVCPQYYLAASPATYRWVFGDDAPTPATRCSITTPTN